MESAKKNVGRVSDNLLIFLREEMDNRKLDYEIPLTQLEGGFDTSVFHFRLKNAHPSLSGPLVLRIFRKSHPPRQAVKESVIHNSLVDQGFPVPYVYYACTDDKYLGNQFLIMDFLTGMRLPEVFDQDTPTILGKKHAALHNTDSSHLNEDMIASGFGGRQYGTEGILDYLIKASTQLPWLVETASWLIKNKPSKREHPSICHGDFHPYNLLAKDGKITAILDWSSCRVGDPASDVASTLVIFNAATRHIIPAFDSEIETKKYLDAYRSKKDLDEQHLRYYKVLFSALRLFIGTREVIVWTQPPIRKELINIILELSKIHVEVPGE